MYKTIILFILLFICIFKEFIITNYTDILINYKDLFTNYRYLFDNYREFINIKNCLYIFILVYIFFKINIFYKILLLFLIFFKKYINKSYYIINEFKNESFYINKTYL